MGGGVWEWGGGGGEGGRGGGRGGVVDRSRGGTVGTVLGMGDWGRRWRKTSALARAQRAAEKRALPPVLAAHEVEAFRGQWMKEELGQVEQTLEELESIAEWGHEVWKERGSETPARGAPADSKWEGRPSSEVLGRGEALASEAERIILDSLVAAAVRLHPAGGGRSRQVRRGGGKSRWRRIVGKLNKALAAAEKKKWRRVSAVVRSTQRWAKPLAYPGADKKGWIKAAEGYTAGGSETGGVMAKRGVESGPEADVARSAHRGLGDGHDSGRPPPCPARKGAQAFAEIFQGGL